MKNFVCFVLLILFRHVFSVRQMSCQYDESEIGRGLTGFPGKQGPRGKAGIGTKGSKGEPGSNEETWIVPFERLEEKIIALQDSLPPISFSQGRSIKHFDFPGNGDTMYWGDAVMFCLWKNMELCEYIDIFPDSNNIPAVTGILMGDHWTPISDIYNDWAEIGNSVGRNGFRHIQHYGPPAWGVHPGNNRFPGIKGNVFCCTKK